MPHPSIYPALQPPGYQTKQNDQYPEFNSKALKSMLRAHAHGEAFISTNNIGTQILVPYYAIQITPKHTSETNVIPKEICRTIEN